MNSEMKQETARGQGVSQTDVREFTHTQGWALVHTHAHIHIKARESLHPPRITLGAAVPARQLPVSIYSCLMHF